MKGLFYRQRDGDPQVKNRCPKTMGVWVDSHAQKEEEEDNHVMMKAETE